MTSDKRANFLNVTRGDVNGQIHLMTLASSFPAFQWSKLVFSTTSLSATQSIRLLLVTEAEPFESMDLQSAKQFQDKTPQHRILAYLMTFCCWHNSFKEKGKMCEYLESYYEHKWPPQRVNVTISLDYRILKIHYLYSMKHLDCGKITLGHLTVHFNKAYAFLEPHWPHSEKQSTACLLTNSSLIPEPWHSRRATHTHTQLATVVYVLLN